MPSLSDRLELVTRLLACMLAGVPSTSLIPLPLTMALTHRFRREELLKRLHLMVPWARFCRQRILQMDLDVAGREHLPSPSRGHMYVSNHQSWADILVLLEALDTAAFLSKDLIRHIPVIGRCAYAGGTVFVDRARKEHRQQALEETLRMCRESTAVVVFPEGTRSADGELRERIQPGALKAAHEAGLRFVPVGLDGTRHVLPKSMDRVGTGQRVAVTIGPSLFSRDFDDEEACIQAVWDQVARLFAQSRQRLRAGG